MSKNDSSRKNQKLQAIDLTDETFNFESAGFTIEGFTDHSGKQWFSAETVCKNLDLKNVSQAVSSLPDKDKAIIIYNRDNDNRGVRHLMVSEPGLYRLIFKSRNDVAEDYQEWVFSTVLPTIRRAGGYIAPTATPSQNNWADRLQYKSE